MLKCCGASLLPRCVKLSSYVDKPKVLLARCDYLESAVELLRQHFEVECWDNVNNGDVSKEKLVELIRGKFGVVIDSQQKIDHDIIAAGGSTLRVVSTVSTGVDNVDLEALRRHRVRLGSASGVNLEATAELTVALLLVTSRRIVQGIDAVKNGGWSSTLNHPWLNGQGLHDSTVGIIGYGRIGHSVAMKLKSFLPKQILYTSREEKPTGAEIGAVFTDLDTLLRSSDFVILTIALTPETAGIMSRSKIALMKKNAVFVNTGRGALVDQDALVEALQQKKIFGAGLDVMTPEPLPLDHPLQRLENCVLLPHMGWSSSKSKEDMFHLAANNAIAVLKGAPMPAEYVL
ncbi:unnamed protein product [Bemisia tabaci]|uniref:Glyoxylate reductase/hydroxypyruvate reductase n=1 Tax=Bemisia tabaci TaxID=7038 RepID=A0A9N9ZZQ2_BEMTA|nr:unnamed protein product [Bemisia tabaci]